MKVLKGGLTEIKYSWPQQTDALITDCEPKCIGGLRNDSDEGETELQELSRTAMNTNEVFYINGRSRLIMKVQGISPQPAGRISVFILPIFIIFDFPQTTSAYIEWKILATPMSPFRFISIALLLTAVPFSTRQGREHNAR